MDWAKAIENEIVAAYSSHGAILAADGDGLIAAALRKAKDEGMREAASMMCGICVNEFDAANQKAAREQVTIRADQIEKGKS